VRIMFARALGLVSHAIQLYFTCVAVFILAVWQLLAAAAAAVDVRLDRLLRKAAGSNRKVLRVAARFFWRCYRRLLLLFPSPPPPPLGQLMTELPVLFEVEVLKHLDGTDLALFARAGHG
jgi:hypothetical protein